jgi:hypothetical protein
MVLLMAQRISLLGARIKCGADLFEMRMFLKQCHDQFFSSMSLPFGWTLSLPPASLSASSPALIATLASSATLLLTSMSSSSWDGRHDGCYAGFVFDSLEFNLRGLLSDSRHSFGRSILVGIGANKRRNPCLLIIVSTNSDIQLFELDILYTSGVGIRMPQVWVFGVRYSTAVS